MKTVEVIRLLFRKVDPYIVTIGLILCDGYQV